MHPGGYGQADGDQEDSQDHRSPAKRQARKSQAAPLFTGVPDLTAGHVAEHDRRDGRQRPDHELPYPAGEARHRVPVGPAWGHEGWVCAGAGRGYPHGQVGHDLVQVRVGTRGQGGFQAGVVLVLGQPALGIRSAEESRHAVSVRVSGP